MAKKRIESAYIIEFGNHGNKQNCIKAVFFYPKKDGGNNNKFRILSRTTVVSMTTKSYNSLNY